MNDSHGYWSTVRGWLETDGHRLAMAQVGADFCVLRRSVASSPTEAELVIEIDGIERRKRVFLPAGISASSRRVPFTQR